MAKPSKNEKSGEEKEWRLGAKQHRPLHLGEKPLGAGAKPLVEPREKWRCDPFTRALRSDALLHKSKFSSTNLFESIGPCS
jgi:hypothetical protein